jgi:hypothetical protein
LLLNKKSLKQASQSLSHKNGETVKEQVFLILGCVVLTSLHYCIVGLASFSQLKEIFGQQTVSVTFLAAVC